MKMGEQSQYEQVHYEIRVHGRVDPSWSEWFDGLTITPGINGDTLLAGPIADQAVLYGVISRIRDLGLVLLAVVQYEPATENGPSTTLN
jgi:hypothetical protein